MRQIQFSKLKPNSGQSILYLNAHNLWGYTVFHKGLDIRYNTVVIIIAAHNSYVSYARL